MKVLVTGAKGQLGQDVVSLLKEQTWEVFGFGREELNITDEKQVSEKVLLIQPDIIIHTAAYTQVDQAESDEEAAFKVNAEGTKYLAQAAEVVGAKFCYVSTDYVFDGTKETPYKADDQTNPRTVYGKSKLVGEQYTQEYCSKSYIVRTSWVFGLYGNNFVKTMLRLAEENKELGIVHDQVGSPTYTTDLARFIISLVQTDKYGVYHGSNSGVCSWYEFAKEIFKQSNIEIVVNPLKTEDFPRPAARPKYSVLDKGMIEENGFESFQNWKEALKDFLKKL
ncbi:dTDP-4-dehydrorhamnose reductase [Bacillus thuringiensis]|uniref:dTDP-4-dehydrorhamnose reductase n=1 Tax=Bacillus thuringiensis TaxID=1428 RepID=UPI000A3C7CF8|nr:dTDP-4-dehydrorhamnose reductase [Bacillus thuringiensis]MED3351284.1 dTDP-4-dehydrorhamnose reductase [Bacillus thuringiensis]MRB11736.1 dTDP-4-dehydrorhamnose reductase [Bacillus thuringiensis]OTW80645.1 dTDP-4-dehydrorhamnose reductase [Bacillus thuringiensis serovar sumiyoshiensis]OTW91371.1 dTDP-4-dehydrorhamnose reductase [Bacillus thuringiensis serovar fukuokaensis]PEB11223.1 dTDP-4-dehydrorhamnose reductase [Bacillus thuringiensis]